MPPEIKELLTDTEAAGMTSTFIMENNTNVNTPNKIIVHHTGATVPDPQFEAINEWHRLRAFPISKSGNYCGYHYVVEKDGTVRQAREDGEEGAHTIGQNFTSLGICLVGNFDTEEPTEAQIRALGDLLIDKCKQYDISILQIYPHRKFSAKSCFGSRLDVAWAQMVALDAGIRKLNS